MSLIGANQSGACPSKSSSGEQDGSAVFKQLIFLNIIQMMSGRLRLMQRSGREISLIARDQGDFESPFAHYQRFNM